MELPGSILSQSDLDQLARCGIDPEVVTRALWRRVDTFTGAEVVGTNGRRDYSGLAIPYFWPGSQDVREFRLRRDNPEIDLLPNGEKKFKNRYLSPPDRGNKLYFHPDTRAEWLHDVALPIVMTEGEKKALALWGLSWHALAPDSQLPRWLPMAIAGVWCWKGTAGKVEGPTGKRLNVTAPIPDLDRINWRDRAVTIIFDANVQTNGKVKFARRELAKELRQRGARVFFVDVPHVPGINGIDDLTGIWGKDRVRYFVERERYEDSSTGGRVVIGCIPSVRSFGAMRIEFMVQGLIARGAVHLFSGDSGHGKSTLMTALAGAIAGGVDFAGRCCAQSPVLVLDRENPRSVVAERLERLGVQDGNALQIWGGWNVEEPPDVGCKRILCWVMQTEPKPLIVVDSFISFLKGDENSATDVRAFTERMRTLANAGATLIVVHHSGKAETSRDYRGSSDIKASVDVAFSIANSGGCELQRLHLKAFKARFPVEKELSLDYVGGTFRARAAAGEDRHHDQCAFARLIKERDGITKAEYEALCVQKGLTRAAAREFVRTALIAGNLKITPGVKNKKHLHLDRGGAFRQQCG